MIKYLQQPSAVSAGKTNLNRHYLMSPKGINQFIHEINTPNFIEDITKIQSSPIDNIVSLFLFPINWHEVYPHVTTPPLPIRINTRLLTSTGLLVLGAPPVIDIGTIQIDRHFNNFLDFAPYSKYQIYLPYIGFEDLDPNYLFSQGETQTWLKIRYVIDPYTGKCTAYLIKSDDEHLETNDFIFMIREGQIGSQVQVAGGYGAEISRNIEKFAISMISTVATIAAAASTGGASTGATGAAGTASAGASSASGISGVMAINSMGNTLLNASQLNQVTVHKGGQTIPNNGFYAPQSAYIIITRPKIVRPTGYDALYGRPSAKVKSLDNCHGFTMIDSVHVEGVGFKEALSDEIDQIEALLKSGVILPDPPTENE